MRRVVWLVALLSVACSGGAEHPADAASDDAGTGSIEVGSGETAFEPTVDGQHLKLYAGTQGGHHVWLSYRVYGLSPKNVRMVLDVVPTSPARPAHTDVKLDLTPISDDADGYEFVGWPARILDPECAVGEPVSLSLTLTDAQGREASGTMNVIPDPPDLGFTRTCSR